MFQTPTMPSLIATTLNIIYNIVHFLIISILVIPVALVGLVYYAADLHYKPGPQTDRITTGKVLLLLLLFALTPGLLLCDLALTGNYCCANWLTFIYQIKRVAVIGGGASGITAAKEALEHGFEVVLFEQTDSVRKPEPLTFSMIDNEVI